jgi:hypothetical protein
MMMCRVCKVVKNLWSFRRDNTQPGRKSRTCRACSGGLPVTLKILLPAGFGYGLAEFLQALPWG